MQQTSYPTDIKELTALRWFAAMAVVGFHSRFQLPEGWGWGVSYWEKGYLAVDFFFMLSGFILAHVYADGFLHGKVTAGEFWRKRLARVYPLHLVTMLGFVALFLAYRLTGIQPNDMGRYDLAALPGQLLLVHAWGGAGGLHWNGPSWSISAEWFAYLLFPFLLLGWRQRWWLAMAVGLLLICWWVAPVMTGERLTRLEWEIATLRVLPMFMVGIGLYGWMQQKPWPASVARMAFWGSLLGVLWFPLSGMGDAVAVALFALLIAASAEMARHGLPNLFRHRWAVFGGEVSYALYMVHALVGVVWFNAIAMLLPAWKGSASVWLGYVLLVQLAAVVAHYWVERPGRRWMMAGR